MFGIGASLDLDDPSTGKSGAVKRDVYPDFAQRSGSAPHLAAEYVRAFRPVPLLGNLLSDECCECLQQIACRSLPCVVTFHEPPQSVTDQASLQYELDRGS